MKKEIQKMKFQDGENTLISNVTAEEVNQKDKWSLFSLGNNSAKIIELKFVSTMKRKYQFSVDSFHIIQFLSVRMKNKKLQK